MILNLTSESDVNLKNLKKLETLTGKTTVLFNHATWCGHCHMFRPEWEQFKEQMGGTKVNFVEIESSALSKIRENKKMYKKVTPTDGAVYFPMVIFFIKKGDKCEKKLYEGNRDASSLKTFIESKTPKKTIKKVKPKEKITKNIPPITNKSLSLFEINKELENILAELKF